MGGQEEEPPDHRTTAFLHESKTTKEERKRHWVHGIDSFEFCLTHDSHFHLDEHLRKNTPGWRRLEALELRFFVFLIIPLTLTTYYLGRLDVATGDHDDTLFKRFVLFSSRCVALRLPRWPFFFMRIAACFSRPLVFWLLFGPIESPLRFSCATGWLALPAGTGEKGREETLLLFLLWPGWLVGKAVYRTCDAMHLHIPRVSVGNVLFCRGFAPRPFDAIATGDGGLHVSVCWLLYIDAMQINSSLLPPSSLSSMKMRLSKSTSKF